MRIRNSICGKGGLDSAIATEENRHSTVNKRNKFAAFFTEKLPEFARKSAELVFTATAATVFAVACSGDPTHTGSPDTSTDTSVDSTDGHTDGDTYTPGACPGSYDELEGEVPSLMAKNQTKPLYFNGPEGDSVSGTADITVGGMTEGLLVLGDCAGEADTVAAFGGSEATVVPSFRIDVPDARGEFNPVGSESCSPTPDAPPISMFNGEANLTLIPAQLGSIPGGAEVGLVGPFVLKVVDGTGAELSNPISLLGVNSIMVVSESSVLALAAKLLSGEGSELAMTEVHASVDAASSKKIKIFRTDSMVPTIGNWRVQGTPGPDGSVYACTRPSLADGPETVVITPVEIDAEVIEAAISDSCGKIFASFDIISLNVEFDTRRFTLGIEPLQFSLDYSFANESNYGEGLDAMSEGSPKAYMHIKRTGDSHLDTGDFIIMDLKATFTIQSRDVNPLTGEKDTGEGMFYIRVSVPSLANYYTICGYTPALFD